MIESLGPKRRVGGPHLRKSGGSRPRKLGGPQPRESRDPESGPPSNSDNRTDAGFLVTLRQMCFRQFRAQLRRMANSISQCVEAARSQEPILLALRGD